MLNSEQNPRYTDQEIKDAALAQVALEAKRINDILDQGPTPPPELSAAQDSPPPRPIAAKPVPLANNEVAQQVSGLLRVKAVEAEPVYSKPNHVKKGDNREPLPGIGLEENRSDDMPHPLPVNKPSETVVEAGVVSNEEGGDAEAETVYNLPRAQSAEQQGSGFNDAVDAKKEAEVAAEPLYQEVGTVVGVEAINTDAQAEAIKQVASVAKEINSIDSKKNATRWEKFVSFWLGDKNFIKKDAEVTKNILSKLDDIKNADFKALSNEVSNEVMNKIDGSKNNIEAKKQIKGYAAALEKLLTKVPDRELGAKDEPGLLGRVLELSEKATNKTTPETESILARASQNITTRARARAASFGSDRARIQARPLPPIPQLGEGKVKIEGLGDDNNETNDDDSVVGSRRGSFSSTKPSFVEHFNPSSQGFGSSNSLNSEDSALDGSYYNDNESLVGDNSGLFEKAKVVYQNLGELKLYPEGNNKERSIYKSLDDLRPEPKPKQEGQPNYDNAKITDDPLPDVPNEEKGPTLPPKKGQPSAPSPQGLDGAGAPSSAPRPLVAENLAEKGKERKVEGGGR